MNQNGNPNKKEKNQKSPPSQGAPSENGGKHLSKRSRRRAWLIALLAVLALVLTTAAVYTHYVRAPEIPLPTPTPGASDSTEAPVEAGNRKAEFYTFLICGTDDGNGGADTIMVASFDVAGKSISIMNIPRDTMVNVRWSTKKINSTYNAGGVEMLKSEVEKLIGFQLDFTVKVDLDAFVKLVNAIDGVEYEVPFDMNYDDSTQNLHIHLKKGLQTLTGEEAIGVVRWRKNNSGGGYRNGDLGRIQTQQGFLTAVAKQCFQIGNVTKINEFAKIFKEDVETDLTVGNIIWFCQKALALDIENIHFYTMPYAKTAMYHGGSYVIPDGDGLCELVNTSLSSLNEPVTKEKMDIMSINADGSLSSSSGVLADPNAAHPPVKTTPKPTATPKATATPKPTATPEPSTVPAASATPIPTATPVPSAEPVPSATQTLPAASESPVA